MRATACLAVGLFLCGCSSPDQKDQAALKRLCGIPPEATVLTWNGVGTHERHDFSISGTFALSAALSHVHENQALASGFRPLPIPDEERTMVETFFRNDAALRKFGLWACRTAGANALDATSTRPCEPASVATQQDMILCVYDRAQSTAFAGARMKY